MEKEYRIDNTGFGDIRIKQCPEEFCYGTDAVILAHQAAEISVSKHFEKIIDLGTGTGIIPLILSHKTGASLIAGVEIQKHSFDLAEENIIINGLSERLKFFNCNVRELTERHPELCGSFDAVTTNPPYTAGACGIESSNKAKALARHEIEGSLDDFLKTASVLLKDRGDFFMVHRPGRLVDICEGCRKYRLEPKDMTFVNGKAGEKPNILLIHCVKNGKRDLKFNNILTMRNNDGSFTEEALKAYRDI